MKLLKNCHKALFIAALSAIALSLPVSAAPKANSSSKADPPSIVFDLALLPGSGCNIGSIYQEAISGDQDTKITDPRTPSNSNYAIYIQANKLISGAAPSQGGSNYFMLTLASPQRVAEGLTYDVGASSGALGTFMLGMTTRNSCKIWGAWRSAPPGNSREKIGGRATVLKLTATAVTVELDNVVLAPMPGPNQAQGTITFTGTITAEYHYIQF